MEENLHSQENLKSEAKSKFFQASEHMRLNRGKIKEIWECKVREQIPSARDKSSLVLVNSLDIFLDELIQMLENRKSSPERLSEKAMSKIHGGGRARLVGYMLPQVLKEFSLLRAIIYQDLHEKNVLNFEILSVIDKAIDEVISREATEFTEVLHSKTKTALARAEISNRDLEHFAAIAAHDLKSPLATISGYLSLLEDEYADRLGTEGIGYVDLMQRAGTRMRHLVDRLLEYARLTQENRPFQPTSTKSAVEASLQNLSDTIEKQNASVMCDRLPVVLGDIDLLTQLFQNLIANGIKFHGSRTPEIKIGCEEKNGMWVFAVKDNGVGFDPKYKEDIFALYKKLHSETEYQGAGIGLATCRKVVELHGGMIWADSELGVGSTFYFTLPKIKRKSEVHH